MKKNIQKCEMLVERTFGGIDNISPCGNTAKYRAPYVFSKKQIGFKNKELLCCGIHKRVIDAIMDRNNYSERCEKI